MKNHKNNKINWVKIEENPEELVKIKGMTLLEMRSRTNFLSIELNDLKNSFLTKINELIEEISETIEDERLKNFSLNDTLLKSSIEGKKTLMEQLTILKLQLKS